MPKACPLACDSKFHQRIAKTRLLLIPLSDLVSDLEIVIARLVGIHRALLSVWAFEKP